MGRVVAASWAAMQQLFRGAPEWPSEILRLRTVSLLQAQCVCRHQAGQRHSHSMDAVGYGGYAAGHTADPSEDSGALSALSLEKPEKAPADDLQVSVSYRQK